MKALDKLKKETVQSTFKLDKHLCIVEGKLELLYIKKTLEIISALSLTCDDFRKKVLVQWGRGLTPVDNECGFQGGNQPGSAAPFPALEALILKKASLYLYKSIIIIFDADVDTNSDVYNQVMKILIELSLDTKIALVYSSPCFEKTLLDFIWNAQIEQYIDTNNIYMCPAYKKYFSQLTSLYGFPFNTGINEASDFVSQLTDTEFALLNDSSQLKCIINALS